MKKILLPLLCCLLLFTACSKPAQTVQTDTDANSTKTALKVNGEAVTEGEIQEVIKILNETYDEYELDRPSEEEIREQAIEQVVRNTVVEQYIRELGLDEISNEEAETIRNAADTAWEKKVDEYVANYSTFLDEDDDDSAFRSLAEGYYATQGYTYERVLEELEQYCRAQHLYNYLMDGIEISDEEVEEYYDQRLSEDEAYADNIELYERLMYGSGRAMLYTPEGYRAVLQIQLPVDDTLMRAYSSAGDEAELAQAESEILEAYQTTTNEIYERLESGEEFADLVQEYGSDEQMLNYLDIGYQVHENSIIYPEAFVKACFSMEEPGECSEPFITTEGIHIVYYLWDLTSAPLELTEDVKLALSGELIDEQVSQKYTALADELYAKAEVVRY